MKKIMLAVKVLMGQTIVISKRNDKIALHSVGMSRDVVVNSLASALKSVV